MDYYQLKDELLMKDKKHNGYSIVEEDEEVDYKQSATIKEPLSAPVLFENIYIIICASYLNVLLVVLPICFLPNISQGIRLVLSMISLIPLTKLLTVLTDEASSLLNEAAGGLLNATLGNLPELVIGVMTVNRNMIRLAQISMFGSIIGNLLLVMGSSFIAHALRYGTTQFNSLVGRINAVMMVIVVLGCTTVALFNTYEYSSETELLSSRMISIIFILLYCVYLYFSLYYFKEQFDNEEENGDDEEEGGNSYGLSIFECIFSLFIISVLISLTCNVIIDLLQPVAENWNISQFFIVGILLPLVGNVAEHSTAVVAAYRNKLTLSISIGVGSACQVGSFLTATLVIVGWIIGHDMSLNFGASETCFLVISVLMIVIILLTKTSSMMGGCSLIIFYLCVAAYCCQNDA